MMSLSDSSVTQSLNPKKVDEVLSDSGFPPPPPPPCNAAFSSGDSVDSPALRPVSEAEVAALGDRPPGGVRVDEVEGPGDCRPRCGGE